MRNLLPENWLGSNTELRLLRRGRISFIVLGLACSVAAWLTMRPAYASWMTLNWILFTSVGFILCIPRYTLVMFPIYILLAHIARYRICAAIITTWCLLSSGLLIALFVRGWWVS